MNILKNIINQKIFTETFDCSLATGVLHIDNVNFAGEDEDIKETQAFLGQSLIFSLVLMSIVLMIQFNSAWQTIVTMSAIILSTGGIFLLLFLTERPFGVVMSMLGLIALAGIVVNNAIVLIDFIKQLAARKRDELSLGEDEKLPKPQLVEVIVQISPSVMRFHNQSGTI